VSRKLGSMVQETVQSVGGLSAISLGGPTRWTTGKRDDQGRDDLPALFPPILDGLDGLAPINVVRSVLPSFGQPRPHDPADERETFSICGGIRHTASSTFGRLSATTALG
jgi:hypothetical protein